MAANSFRLRTFGGLHLERGSGERVPGEALQRRLLLVALAAEAGDRGVSRDRVIGLLWPESDEEHGRRSLNQLRYTLRRELGGVDLVVGTSTLRVDPACLESDLADFRAAIARGDADTAASVHRAPFLDGVFAEGAPELDQWVEDRRRECRSMLEDALIRATRAAKPDDGTAVARWRRLIELDPLNAVYAVGAMEALAGRGDATGALAVADRHEATVLRELGVLPDRTVADAAARIREHTRPVRSVGWTRPAPSADTALPAGDEVGPTAALPAPPTRRRWRGPAIAAVGLLVAIGGLYRWLGPRAPAGTTPRLVVAMVPAGASEGEADALRLLDLAIHRVAVGRELPAPVVRATLQRMRRSDSTAALDVETAREVAQREGVPWVVVGRSVAAPGRLAVRYQVEEAVGGRVVRSREEVARSAADLGAATDRLAARLAADLEDIGPGTAASPMPYVTTASLEALRAYQGSNRLVNSGNRGYLTLLQRAVSLDSNFPAAQARLAYAYWFEYDQARADRHAAAAERALAGVEPRERLWITREVANAREDWPAAIASARAMVERDRESSSEWHALAQLLYFDGQYGRSVEAYDSAMAHAQAHDSLTLFVNLATVLARQSRFGESADWYRRAFQRDSFLLDDPFIYLEYGAVLLHLGRPDETRAVYQRPLGGRAVDRPAALRALALLEAFEGRYAKAVELLEESATASTAAADSLGSAVAHMLLAEINWLREEGSAARTEIASVAEIAGRAPLPYEVLARCVKLAARLGDLAQAGTILRRLESQTRARSGSAKARMLMARGEIELARGAREEGRRSLEQAFALEPSDDLLESAANAALATGAAATAASRYDSLATGEGLDWDGYAVRGIGRYQAAVAWDLAGDTAKAGAGYRAFASAWRGADSGLKLLRRARERAGRQPTP